MTKGTMFLDIGGIEMRKRKLRCLCISGLATVVVWSWSGTHCRRFVNSSPASEAGVRQQLRHLVWAAGSLAVRASDPRPDGLGSMPDATKYPPSTHKFLAEIVEVEIVGVAIYRFFGEFRRAKSYCHLYGAQGLGHRQAYF
ncbi:hypothetical protein TNCV_1839201 [Trichonephila clavipes]|nr:hypothetical protein TNCV_1839201 [Trichonephila clavipes]